MSQDPQEDPTDLLWMKRALSLAQQAQMEGEVPVGALVVLNGEIIGEGWNQRETLLSPTAHAEVRALEKAAQKLQSWRLIGATLYVTLEPCLMCAGALLQARVSRVVFGTRDPKAGAAKSLYQALEDSRLNHRCEVVEGVLQQECGDILSQFFRARRQDRRLLKSCNLDHQSE